MNDRTIVIDTPEGIRRYTVLAQRSALKLEMRGLRHSGGSVAARIRRAHPEIPGRSKAEVLAWLEKEIASWTS